MVWRLALGKMKDVFSFLLRLTALFTRSGMTPLSIRFTVSIICIIIPDSILNILLKQGYGDSHFMTLC